MHGVQDVAVQLIDAVSAVVLAAAVVVTWDPSRTGCRGDLRVLVLCLPWFWEVRRVNTDAALR